MKANDNKKVVCNITFETKVLFSEYILNQVEDDDLLEKVEHETTEQTGDNAKIDYRYIGSDPDNYVCFGSENETCPDDNLYRIIGVIPTQSEVGGSYENRVKLIKANATTKSTWSGSASSNQYDKSNVYSYLNTTYWESITNYQKYIDNVLWNLGVFTANQNAITPNQFYLNERNGSSKKIVAPIGLMYASDYGFQLGETYFNKSLYDNRNQFMQGWLFASIDVGEWTIDTVPESNTYVNSLLI